MLAVLIKCIELNLNILNGTAPRSSYILCVTWPLYTIPAGYCIVQQSLTKFYTLCENLYEEGHRLDRASTSLLCILESLFKLQDLCNPESTVPAWLLLICA